MKVTMKLTMDGLKRSLSAIARSMADEAEWRYAGTGEYAGRASAVTERETARTDRHERGGD